MESLIAAQNAQNLFSSSCQLFQSFLRSSLFVDKGISSIVIVILDKIVGTIEGIDNNSPISFTSFIHDGLTLFIIISLCGVSKYMKKLCIGVSFVLNLIVSVSESMAITGVHIHVQRADPTPSIIELSLSNFSDGIFCLNTFTVIFIAILLMRAMDDRVSHMHSFHSASSYTSPQIIILFMIRRFRQILEAAIFILLPSFFLQFYINNWNILSFVDGFEEHCLKWNLLHISQSDIISNISIIGYFIITIVCCVIFQMIFDRRAHVALKALSGEVQNGSGAGKDRSSTQREGSDEDVELNDSLSYRKTDKWKSPPSTSSPSASRRRSSSRPVFEIYSPIGSLPADSCGKPKPKPSSRTSPSLR